MNLHVQSLTLFAVISGLFFGLSALIVRHTDFGAKMARTDSSHEFATLEGLRGLLAVCVFIAHLANFGQSLMTPGGSGVPSPLYNNLGHTAVFYFFLITGFLFWLRIVRKPDSIRIVDFFKKRFFRLVPAYAVSVVATVGVALYFSWPIKVPPLRLAQEIVPWFGFRIFGLPDINDLHAEEINAPYWSLRYEWAFYALIPLFALIGKKRPWRFLIIASVTALTLWFGSQKVPGKILGFVGGMVAAEIIGRGLTDRLKHKYLGIAVLATTLWLLLFIDTDLPQARYTAQVLYWTPLFILCVADNPVIAPLKNKALRFIGTVSFDIYIFHNIILYIVFKYTAKTPEILQWWKALACVPIVLAISVPVHLFVEKPLMKGWPRKARKTPAYRAACGDLSEIKLTENT